MPTDRPSILWLHSDRFGCGTYRCYIPALSLEAMGFDNNFLPHDGVPAYGGVTQATPSIERRDPLAKGLDDFTGAVVGADVASPAQDTFNWLDGMDLVVFQRAVGLVFRDAMVECRRRGIPTVFEADDDLFNIHKENPSAPFWHLPAIQRLLREQLRLADHIIVSTPPLKAAVVDAIGCGSSKITVCYNHLHSSVWGPAITGEDVQPRFKNEVNGKPYTTIGWQGSATHNLDFREALPALTRIVGERDDVVIRFFGNVPLTARGQIPEARFQWSRGVQFEYYPSQLAYMNFDIGIAPITNIRFNQAKSNLKWLEYSSIGVPTVASAVFPYAQSIDQGVTGIVCRTDEDWYQALTALIDNPEERRAMGARAKAHVWQHWGEHRAEAWAAVFVALLRAHHGEHLLPELVRRAGDGAVVGGQPPVGTPA